MEKKHVMESQGTLSPMALISVARYTSQALPP
jgi:hypothetical protein